MDYVIELTAVVEKRNPSEHYVAWLSNRKPKITQGSSQVLDHCVGFPKDLRGSRVVHSALNIVAHTFRQPSMNDAVVLT